MSITELQEHIAEFSEYHEYLLRFLANYLIYFWDGEASSGGGLPDFDFQLLQLLTDQLKNLVDYTYNCLTQNKMNMALDQTVAAKIVHCIYIILDHVQTAKVKKYLAYCDPYTWNRLISFLDLIYKTELTFMPDLLEVTGKLYLPAVYEVNSKAKEDTLLDFIKMLQEVLKSSSDVCVLAKAIDIIMELFGNPAYDNYFIQTGMMKLLSEGQESFNKAANWYLEKEGNLDTHELSAVKDVMTNLPTFLNAKLKNIKF